jgi:2-C-methyl-D-erythritol 4-phosphate cytidylyltransferase/2-C-methyl-D-erythritol 2,4-cyclodiphosphate synthase
MPEKSIAVVIVAAGRGERADTTGDQIPKQYRLVGGRAVLARTVDAFLSHRDVNWVLPVILSLIHI